MRIAHILWSLGTGGTENMVVDIASIQAGTDDVAIFVINDRVEDYMVRKLNPKVKLVLCKRKPGSLNPLPLINLNYKLWKFKPDIIHSHSNRAILSIRVCKNIPKIRTIHGIGNNTNEYPLYKQLVAISNTVKDSTILQGFNSIVVTNGIDTNKINNIRKISQNDKLHFVQVGRLQIENKGQDILINAIASNTLESMRNFMVHFIGDGPDYEYLLNLSKEKKVEKYVVFEGCMNQEDIYNSLANYDLCIQPSRSEGFGLTIAEAMAAKVPILVSDIPAPMEVIDNGRLGMHFKAEDAQDCANKIKEFIEYGYDSATIESAFQYVREHYDVSITAKRYLEEYKKVLNG